MDNGKHVDTITSEEGVKQGDCLGSLLFSLSMQRFYTACSKRLENVRCVVVADDLNIVGHAENIVGHAESVFKAFTNFEKSLRNSGLLIRKEKCGILWPHAGEPSEIVRTSATRLGIKLHCGVMPTLGVLVGTGVEQFHTWLEEYIDGYKPYLKLIRHPELPAQVAMLLLRLSVISQLGYLARVVPPSIFQRHAARFDDMVLNTIKRKFALPSRLPDVARWTLSLPIKVGGFGLREVAKMGVPAYFCAMAAAAEAILALIPEPKRLICSSRRSLV